MNALADLLSYLVTSLQRSDSCSAVRVLETQAFSARQFALKVRAELVTGDILQVRVYCNGDHVDYSYQLVRDTELIMRWDNKEHFPEIASYPHHFHSTAGEVRASSLTGDVAHDLPIVLSTLVSFGRA